jgi:two-component system, NarL family, nitrate/nitrite response regulator NarP
MNSLLLIDDNPTLIKDTLISFGYQITTLVDGKQGYEHIVDSDLLYDLIILDLCMPFLSGWDLLKIIRHQSKNPSIPVMILTSNDEESGYVRGLRSGADLYLQKPFEPASLIASVEAICRRAQWTKASEETALPFGELDNLSDRELEILKSIAKEGLSNQELAEKLTLSVHTVKNHLKSILKKMNVKSRTHATLLFLKRERYLKTKTLDKF